MKRLILCFVFVISLTPIITQAQQEELDVSDRIEIMEKFLNSIEYFSKDEINPSDCFRKIMVSGVRGCDEYAGIIIGEDNINSYQRSQGSGYVGIGSSLFSRDGRTILVPFVDSPADSAGVKPGDVLTHIDYTEVSSNTTISEIASMLRDSVGTSVSINILRDGKEVGPIVIERKNVSIPIISSKLINGDIGYIKIYRFGEDLADHFEGLAEELIAQKRASSLIVDLRYNPGGFLGEVTDVVSLFAPQSTPTNPNYSVFISHRGRILNAESTAGPGRFFDIPMVVLVNEYSASASEIMAGVLKDWGVATVVGDTTFGKGSVQRQFFLTTSSTGVDFAIKLTWAEYLVGNKRTSVDGIGIKPDKVVEDNHDWRDGPMTPRGKIDIDLNNDKALIMSLEILRDS